MTTLKISAAEDISTKGHKSFGTNIHHITAWGRAVFINLMKQSNKWRDVGNGNVDPITTDENGYPNYAGTFDLQFHSGDNPDHTGTYTVTWEGTGTLTVAGQPTAIDSTGDHRLSFYLDGENTNVASIVITNTDDGDPIRNIAIVNDLYASNHAAGEIVIPDRLTELRAFSHLRFMWLANEPEGRHGTWDQRPRADFYTWRTLFKSSDNPSGGTIGVPWETCIDIANAADADPWFSVPANVDDDYFHQLGALVKARLTTGLIPVFEYCNEGWNGGFDKDELCTLALRDGWYPDESFTPYYDDLTGWTGRGASVAGPSVLTEDTSTAEHYIEQSVTHGNVWVTTYMVKIEKAGTTAPGVRLVLNDGTDTISATYDFATETVVATSDTAAKYFSSNITDLGDHYHLELKVRKIAATTGYIRIAATNSAHDDSYTGSGETVTIRSAFTCKGDFNNYLEWMGKRSTQMYAQIEAAMEGRPFRVALGNRAGQNAEATKLCEALKWQTEIAAGRDPGPYVAPYTRAHFLAINGYWGNNSGPNGAKDKLFSLTNQTAIWAAFDGTGGERNQEAAKEVLIAAGGKSGLIVDCMNITLRQMAVSASAAGQYGLKLVCYEGGNHSYTSLNRNKSGDLYTKKSLKPGIAAMIEYVMWHADTGIAYADYLAGWRERGGTIWCQYNDIQRFSISGGFFGLRRWPGDGNALALAVDAWAAANPRWWAH